MMQRDETLLLDPWLRYYGYLFGFENLTVFDNGSIEPAVIGTLRTYEQAGVTVIREHSRVEDFHAKGAHFKNVIQHWDALDHYDFALPLDCDEFLLAISDDGLDCRRNSIHAELDRRLDEQRVLGISHSFYNVPSMRDCFWPDPYPKTFLAAGTIAELDHGFHAARSHKAEGIAGTSLTYLHMHNKPFDMLLQHAKRKLALFTDTDDVEHLRSYTGPGLHLVKYFFMTDGEYHSQFDNKTLVQFDGFGLLMRALGFDALASDDNADTTTAFDVVRIASPITSKGDRSFTDFDGAAYLAANPDVRAAGWRPFEHFLSAGAREGRRLRPATLGGGRRIGARDT